MNQNKVTLVKLGGSLITYKQDEDRINKYLAVIDQFRAGTASLEDLTMTIAHLLNTSTLKEIFRTLNIHIKSNGLVTFKSVCLYFIDRKSNQAYFTIHLIVYTLMNVTNGFVKKNKSRPRFLPLLWTCLTS